MAGRWGSDDGQTGSRWSGARERDEKDRAREERSRQLGSTYDPAHSRFAEPPPPPPPPEEPRPKRRRMSNEDRQSIRKWRSGVPERATAGRTRRSADQATPKLTSGGKNGMPGLPDLPDEESVPAGRSGPSNRVLILGAGLLLLVALILIVPNGIVSRLGGTDPTPTPARILTLTPTAATRNDTLAGQLRVGTPVAGGNHGIVCIDPGHGGWDPGFTRLTDSRAPEMREADINLAMAYMLKDRLEAQGFTVVMTRDSAAAVNIFNQDVNGDGKTIQFNQSGDQQGLPIESSMQDGQRDELQARINVCNKAKADLMISLHINGYGDTSARGYEVWYTKERPFGDKSETFANYVYRELKKGYDSVGFQTDARGVRPDDQADADLHGYGTEKHYIMIGPAIPGPVGQITPSAMPGVIAEPVFLSNDDDAAFLAEPKNQAVIVDAYERAILQYFQTYPAAPGQ